MFYDRNSIGIIVLLNDILEAVCGRKAGHIFRKLACKERI